jgi:hypothetical protein
MTQRWPIVAAALLLATGASAAERNPNVSPTVTATSETLDHVLTEATSAAGTLRAGVGSTYETWSYKQGEVSGTESEFDAGKDYRFDRTYAKLHEAGGRYKGRSWHQGYSGFTVLESGVHQRSDRNSEALVEASSGSAPGVTLLGESSSPEAYVVKVAPPGGRIEYRFYDKKTFLVVRRERSASDQLMVTTYDDFRTTDGVTRSWHFRSGDGRPYNDSEWTMTSLVASEAVDEARLQVPPDARNPVALPAERVRLPAKIIDDRIIVTAEMGGHKVNFQLDSGASGILLDRSVADALRIETFGKSTEATAGAYVANQAIIPLMVFNGIRVTNVEAETAPFQTWADANTPIAGLLGFDFIAGCVVAIDYENGTVDAIDAEGFTPPANAIELPIRLDDDVPIIEARVGEAKGEHFILDTGADRSMLFSDFVAAHPKDTKDQGLGDAMTASFPFVSHIFGVGGKIRFHPVQASSLGVASMSFPLWLFFASEQDGRSFEGEDFDGLLGQDLLRNFTVYLDYHHSKIYLTPNARYRLRWGG